MPDKRRRLVLTIAALLWLVSLVAGPVAHVPVTAARQQSTVTVSGEGVEPHFPDSVDFSLQASGFETARAQLNYRLVGQPVTEELQADVQSPGSTLNLRVTLDLTTRYLPPGSDVEYYWTLISPSGDSVDTGTQTFTMVDDRHTWHSLTDSRRRVSVHWYEGSSTFGSNLLSTASGALDRLEHDTNASLQRPASVWVYATEDDFLGALPKNIPEWVGGKAFPDLAVVMAAIADDQTAGEEIKRVIPHELSHLLLYQATLNPYNSPPAWMDEGLAVYNQEVQDPSEDSILKDAAENGWLMPLKALSGSFSANTDQALLSYAESYSVMNFVLSDSRYGAANLAKTVAAFKQGVTYDDALEAGLGVSVDELDKQWQASLPYKIAPPSGQPPEGRFTGGQGFSLPDPLLLVPIGACAALFLLGGVLAGVMLIRRGRRA